MTTLLPDHVEKPYFEEEDNEYEYEYEVGYFSLPYDLQLNIFLNPDQLCDSRPGQY